jgi:fucose 4-O-acetylase-like acetyltransferase
MPLFAFVSGLVLYKVVPDPYLTQVRKRSSGLLVPYFAWFTVTYGLAVVTGRTEVGGYLRELAAVAVYPSNHYALWYLHALFLAALTMAAVALLGSRVRWALPLSAVLAAAALGVPGVREIGFLGLGNALSIYPFVVAGFMAAPARSLIATHRLGLAMSGALALVALSLLAVFETRTQFGLVPALAGPSLRSIVVWGCTAWAAVGLYAAYLWLSGPAVRWQAFVGQRTLGIYAMHSMAQVALLELLGVNSVPLLFVLSVAASLAATLVIERVPGARTVLLGIRPSTGNTPGRPGSPSVSLDT